MSEKWIKARLGDVVTVNPQAEQLPDQFVYVDLESVKCGRLLRENLISKKDAPSRAQRTVKDKDVLFQLVRPYQQNNLYFEKHGSYDYVASTGYAVIRTELESKYYYYYLHRWDVLNRVNAVSTGTGYPAITPCELSKIVVCSPSNVATQRHIAEVLSTCDEVIEKSERAAEKYRQIKAGMLTDLLTRGIDMGRDGVPPPSGNAVGRDGVPPPSEMGGNAVGGGTPTLPGKLRPPPSVAPELYKDSVLGPIPKEWEVKRLGNVTKFIKDGTHATHHDVERGVPLLSAKDVDKKLFRIPVEYRSISERDFQQIHATYVIEPSDLLLTIVGTIGRLAIVDECSGRFAVQRSVAIIRTDTDVCDVEYMYYWMLGHKFQRDLELRANASAQAGVYLGELSRLLVKFPKDISEQRAIAERLAAVDERIAVETKAAEKYRKVKAGLMEKLLTPPADAEIEDMTQEVVG